MILCPNCHAENIDGAEECDDCQQPLAALSYPRGKTSVERAIVKNRIAALHPRKPIVVPPTMPVAVVLEVLIEEGIGSVIVVEEGKPVGIFTERDALLRLNDQAAALAHRPVSEFMTPAPVTLDGDARIVFALHNMDLGGYRHIPITTEGRVTGVISVRDILQYLTEQCVTG